MKTNSITSAPFKMAPAFGSLRTTPARGWEVVKYLCREAEGWDEAAWNSAYAKGGPALAAHINSYRVLRGPMGRIGEGINLRASMDGKKVSWNGHHTPGRWVSVCFPSRHEAAIAWCSGTGQPSCYLGGLLEGLI